MDILGAQGRGANLQRYIERGVALKRAIWGTGGGLGVGGTVLLIVVVLYLVGAFR